MNDRDLLTEIKKRVVNFERPKRRALSLRYPRLKTTIIATKRLYNHWRSWYCLSGQHRYGQFFPQIVARHSSVLRRKLGDSDPDLQTKKITNLRIAVSKLNGLIIPPGKTFSFWKVVGQPTRRQGYVDAMLLSDGRVIKGLGGGLCQLSNLLFWLFLHAPVEIKERVHHSRDVFPDNGRVLPFGSGATIFYNLVDLKVKNTGSQAIQLKLWLTDTLLKGQLIAPRSEVHKFHVYEQNHCFIQRGEKYYRFNEIWRDELVAGKIIESKKIYTNFAPVMYKPDQMELKKRGVPFIMV